MNFKTQMCSMFLPVSIQEAPPEYSHTVIHSHVQSSRPLAASKRRGKCTLLVLAPCIYMTETRAFGFSVLLGSIICNRETVGKKTCAIKKVAAFAFEAVNDSMVRRCSNERRAYKGRGSFGGWNHGFFRLAYIPKAWQKQQQG